MISDDMKMGIKEIIVIVVYITLGASEMNGVTVPSELALKPSPNITSTVAGLNTTTTFTEALSPQQNVTSTLQHILLEVKKLRVEVALERRHRLETQSLAVVNAESLRRLQRSLLVLARDTRDSVARLLQEQTRLEQEMLQQTDTTEVKEDIANLRGETKNLKERLDALEISTTSQPLPFDLREVMESKLVNLTKAIDDLEIRLTTAEASQSLLHTVLRDAEESCKLRLRRKFRSLKEDLQGRIRDYNAALTTFTSDLRLLRQEVQHNVNSIKTSIAVQSRKVSDSFHIVQATANQTKDEFREKVYYLARAQQEQIVHQTDLEEHIEDMRLQTKEHQTSLHDIGRHMANISDMVGQLMQRQDSDTSQQLTQLQLEVQCPHPYVKSGSSCFNVLREHLSWPSAQERCREMARGVRGEGDLAMAADDSHPFRSFVRNNVVTLQGEPFVWAGASLSSATSHWTWVDGTSLDHDLFPWGRGEPDPSVDQTFLCVKVSGAALFHNCPNTSVLYAVCGLRVDPLEGKTITFPALRSRSKGDSLPVFASDVSFGDIVSKVDLKKGVVVDEEKSVEVDKEKGVVVNKERNTVVDKEKDTVVDKEKDTVVDKEKDTVVDKDKGAKKEGDMEELREAAPTSRTGPEESL